MASSKKILETQESVALALVNDTIEGLTSENTFLSEQLASVAQMLAFDDKGWDLLFGNSHDDGLAIADVHDASAKIREMMVGNPIVKRGAQLRISYVWSKGIQIAGTEAKAGRPSELARLFRRTVNQDYVFSNAAHEEMERCAYSDGQVFLLGDNRSKELRRVPVSEIVADFRNPNFNEDIWAYKRSWTSYTTELSEGKVVERWYYTDKFTGTKKATIGGVKVDKDQTLIVQAFNKQVGWAWGIPDALPAIAWARLYSEFLKHGTIMSKALAQFAFKATVNTQAGADNSAMKIGSGGTGRTAILGQSNDLVPISSAGKGYDFNSGRAIAAQVASAVEVSIVHLLSDPGAAGSSYGSASNLDLPTKRAIVSRQLTWVDYYKRILRWMGVEESKIDVSFESLDETDPYRVMQMLALAAQLGEVHHDELRPKILEVNGLPSLHTAPPEGVMYANNANSLARKDIDLDTKPTPSGGDLVASQGNATAFTQGGSDNTADLRTDNTIGEMLKAVANEQMLERMEALMARMEAYDK